MTMNEWTARDDSSMAEVWMAPAPESCAVPPPCGTTTDAGLLTPRELEIVQQVASGMRNAEVARSLGIQATTVKKHLGHIFEKLGVRSRCELIIHAFRVGLVEPGVRR
jgi:DNA-binding CsgD family transcriptional regulator